MSELLPLFPLELVLFPGMSLPLHIFEPRYKEMIRLCLEHRQKFGVILALQEAIPRVGCSAAIVKVVRRYDHGRMDILTVGQKRFRVVKLLEDLPYLQGSVDVLADEEESTLEPDSSARLRKLYEEIFSRVNGRAAGALEEEPGFPLSYEIAAELPLALDYKQKLLEMLSEGERRKSLADHLESWLAKLKRLDEVKRKAAGNGQGRPA